MNRFHNSSFIILTSLLFSLPAFAGPPGAEGDLYVSTENRVAQFDGATGALIGTFASGGGLSVSTGLTFGPNGNLFVCSRNSDEVIEFDGDTGAPIGTFAIGGGLNRPGGLTFGPNGNLFVCGEDSDSVVEYDGATGALVGVFASGGDLDRPKRLDFGPSGNLYVSTSGGGVRILEYDGVTGALLGTFTWESAAGAQTFGPNGNLFVRASSGGGAVSEVDGITGATIGTFVNANNPISAILALVFGPDQSLIVAGGGSEGIYQYYGDTGALVRAVYLYDPLVLSYVRYMAFKPLAGPFPPPSLSGFIPVQADNCAPLVGSTVTGTGLVWGAQVRLTQVGEADILGAITASTPDTDLTVSFDLATAAPGLWDLVVTYPDLQTDTLIDALEITACPGPEVTGFAPAAVEDCLLGPLVGATVTGSGFVAGSTVVLSSDGHPDIPGTNVDVQSGTGIVADFDLTAAVVGLWDVVVTNPDPQSGVLPGAFEITNCILPTIDSISPTRIIHPGDGPMVAGIWVYGANLVGGGSPTLTLRRDGWPDLTVPERHNWNSGAYFFNGFTLAGYPLGFYDVIYTRDDGHSYTIIDGLEIVADPDLRIKRIGAWGGAVQAIDVDPVSNLAYVGSGLRLLIFDVSDPANPVELGAVMLDGLIMGLKVRDGYAYIGAKPPAWFSVVDVSDPTAPTVVASGIGAGGGSVLSTNVFLDATGQTAYVDPSNASARAIDISDPVNPNYIGECGGGGNAIFGDLVYGAHPFSGWVGVRQGPATPGCPGPLLGSVFIPEFQSTYPERSELVVAGDYLYITAGFQDPEARSALFVVDVSDPTAPVHVGTWTDPSVFIHSNDHGLDASDGRLYWASRSIFDPQERTMLIFDIATDPTTPQLIGEYTSDAEFAAIDVVGTTAFLGDLREGFTIVDCADPANPVRLSNVFSPAEFMQGALDGDNLYVTDPGYGLSIVDVSQPQAPALLGNWETAGGWGSNWQRTMNWGVAARDGMAYVAAGFAGLQVVNVSDPASPTLAGEFSPWPGFARSFGLTLSPDEPIAHIGVLSGTSSFLVNFDISNPADILDVGSVWLEAAGEPFTIARRSDGIAYIANGAWAVTLDLSDEQTPLLLGSEGIAWITWDVALDDDALYVVNDTGSGWGPERTGLDTFSVATPDNLPVPLAHFASGPGGLFEAYAVAASNGRTYVGIGGQTRSALSILDTSDPASPLALESALLGGAKIGDLIIDGPRVYAITRSSSGGVGIGLGGAGAGVLSYLVYIPGDFDDNGVIDQLDADAFANCFTGPDTEPSDVTCLIFDFDEDNDIDCEDWEAFLLAWTGEGNPPNFVPCDGSPPCPADFDGSGAVGASDLAALLGAWGPCDGDCPADLDDSGDVGAFDLAMLLGAWGACP